MKDKNHNSGAIALWQEKLTYLQEQEAIASDPNTKYSIRKSIEEARQKIKELGGEPASPADEDADEEKPAPAVADEPPEKPTEKPLEETTESMDHPPADDKRGKHGKTTKWVVTVVALLGAAFFSYIWWFQPMTGVADQMRADGLTPNVGLAAHYLPGTVIQFRRGDEVLTRPEILLWPDQCFPDKKPRSAPYFLPSTSGKKDSALRLDASEVASFLPSFGIEGAKTWNIVFTKPQSLAFARLELSEEFSPDCLTRLQKSWDAGDLPAWMATIGESVVASAMTLVVEWDAGVDDGVRSRGAEEVRKTLETADTKIGLVASTSEKTVFEVERQIVVAYRSYSMEAVGSPPPGPE